MTALAAGYSAAVEAWNDPGAFQQKPGGMESYYSLLWAYYLDRSGLVYSQGRLQQLKAANRALYTYTRLIYNPVPNIVDFYVDHLYPHAPKVLNGGATLATPVEDGADEELISAIAQVDQWGNWLSEALRLVRFGASTGSVGVEIEDSLEGEKVAHRILWPSLVDYVKTDTAGNVKEYALEYKAYDEVLKEHYTFRKVVDGEAFQYFRDTKPFDPPERPEDDATRNSKGVYSNDYGFVPMVWIKHKDDGSERGLPAVVNLGKVDEINSLASHRHDHQHKAIEAGKLLSTSGKIMAVTGATGTSDVNQAGGISMAGYDTRNDWTLLKAPDASVSDLGSSFDLSQGDPDVSRLLESFTADYPELQAAKLIEEHGATSGEALKYKLGKAQSKLDQAGAQYSQQVIKLKQMQIAIGGWRYNGGGWTRRDSQRAVFAPYGLDSYAKGDLNFALSRSLLVQELESEREALLAKKAERAVVMSAMVDDLEALRIAGYSEERAAEIMTARAKQPMDIEQ